MATRAEVDLLRSRCLALNEEFKIDDFEILIEDERYILKKYTGNETELYLNDVFDEVSTNAFVNTHLEKIDVGTIKNLSNLCFNNCFYLKEVVATNVETVGVEAFKNCYSLEKVSFGKVKEIGINAFYGCQKLSAVSGLDKLHRIQSRAFYNCISLKEIVAPSVHTVDKAAFMFCHSLKRVQMDKLAVIGKRVFSNCSSLEEIYTPKLQTIMPCGISGCIMLHTLYVTTLESGFSCQDALISLHTIYSTMKSEESRQRMKESAALLGIDVEVLEYKVE